ncbi:hypothetical protein ACFWIB_34795 [Streptomyces sp. NPDC127051]|uniref:hypothetical protein n=1 Tax=Streptomyces sp. NPDC127051 TaxID=3347119 RepID=UPI00365DA65C
MPARLWNAVIFVCILVFVLALVLHGTGAATLAAVGVLVGACGRSWQSMDGRTTNPDRFQHSKIHFKIDSNRPVGEYRREDRTGGTST